MIQYLKSKFCRDGAIPLVCTSTRARVDIHCHCLPGLDDGPKTILDALNLCRALVRDGIATVVATPHQLGRYEHVNCAAWVRQAVDALNRVLEEEGIGLTVLSGGDVRVDERLIDFLREDRVLTLADRGRAILLELPHTNWFAIDRLLAALVARGVLPVISHPERHYAIIGRPQRVKDWVDQGAWLQVTAGSLLGEFGRETRQTAWRLVDLGLVHLVASDAHDYQRRPPRLQAARELVIVRWGEQAARELCVSNPERIVSGRRLTD